MAGKTAQYSVTTKRANGTTLVVKGSLSIGKDTITGAGKHGSAFTLTDAQVAGLVAHGYHVGPSGEAVKAAEDSKAAEAEAAKAAEDSKADKADKDGKGGGGKG